MPWTGGTGRKEAALRGVGSELAPLVYRFVQWVAESAAGAGHATVFYMSREGEFLATVHARLRELGAVPPRVAPPVLEVSRPGTVGLLRRAPAAADWAQLWSLCCDQQQGPRQVGATGSEGHTAQLQ
jgi:hypothetical protein